MQQTFSFLLSFFFFIFFFFFFLFPLTHSRFPLIPPILVILLLSLSIFGVVAWVLLPFVRLSIYGSVYWKELISPLLVEVYGPGPHPDKDGDAYIYCVRIVLVAI